MFTGKEDSSLWSSHMWKEFRHLPRPSQKIGALGPRVLAPNHCYDVLSIILQAGMDSPKLIYNKLLLQLPAELGYSTSRLLL